MESLEANFPVRHRNLSFETKGNKTDIVICSYEDHILVIATQIGAMGTILHARRFFVDRKEEGMSVEPTFSVSVIFGKRDEPMLIATARRLIEHISSYVPSKPLVLSLGLKDHSSETLKEIVAAVMENRLWKFDNFNEKLSFEIEMLAVINSIYNHDDVFFTDIN